MRKRLEPGDRDVGGFTVEPHGRQQRTLRLWRRLVPDPGDVCIAGLDAGERGEPVKWIGHRLGTRKTAPPLRLGLLQPVCRGEVGERAVLGQPALAHAAARRDDEALRDGETGLVCACLPAGCDALHHLAVVAA